MSPAKLTAVVAAIGCLLLTGCREQTAATAGGAQPASIEKVEGTDLHVVKLTDRAVERLGIEIVPVGAVNGGKRLVIPYGALFYDKDGKTWVYTAQSERSFVRDEVKVESIEGERAVLTAGPPAGTEIVSVGAAELFGVETGVGGGGGGGH